MTCRGNNKKPPGVEPKNHFPSPVAGLFARNSWSLLPELRSLDRLVYMRNPGRSPTHRRFPGHTYCPRFPGHWLVSLCMALNAQASPLLHDLTAMHTSAPPLLPPPSPKTTARQRPHATVSETPLAPSLGRLLLPPGYPSSKVSYGWYLINIENDQENGWIIRCNFHKANN